MVPFPQPRRSVCLGYPNQLRGTPGVTLLHHRPHSLARSWVLARFPGKCWFTWRPLPQPPTEQSGYWLGHQWRGPCGNSPSCLESRDVSGGCSGLGLPGKEGMNVLPDVLGRGHGGIYLPFSSLLAAWAAGISWSMGQQRAGGCSWKFPGSHPGVAAGINHGCAAAAAAALGAPSLLGRWLQLLLLSLLCPPLQLLQLTALPSSHCRRGDCAALGMQVIPGTFLLGRSHVLSRWQDSPGRSLGDTSVHRGSRGILDQKSL